MTTDIGAATRNEPGQLSRSTSAGSIRDAGYAGSPPASCPANLANCVVDQANQVLSSYASTGVTVSVTSCTAATTSPPAPATMTILGTYTVVPTLLPAFGTISNTAVPYQVTVPLI